MILIGKGVRPSLSGLGVCAALTFAAVSAAQAQTVIGGDLFVSHTGHVIAKYQGNSASYSNDLLLDAPANGLGVIFNNHATPVGTTKDLGLFNAGDELIFRLYVNNTGDSFFTGAASRNPDGHEHARVTYNFSPTEVLVEFEDLYNGPFNYNDLSFSFTNLQATADTVPEPGTIAFGVIAAGSVLGLAARKRKA